MNYSEMTDEELIKIKKGSVKIALIGEVFIVSALLSLLFFRNRYYYNDLVCNLFLYFRGLYHLCL